MSLTIAATVDDVLAELAAGATPIAGGSDLVVSARQGRAALPDRLVAIGRVPALAAIDASDDQLRIGSGVTHARLMTDPDICARATALADAAALVGSPATRNVGTIGGNVMNGSPAMDTGAPLVVLGARAELLSLRGARTVPVGGLWEGPGSTTAAPDELCTALVLPAPAHRSGSAYVRLEYRRAMEIAVVGAAAAVELTADDAVADIRVALTAVAPTIIEVGGLGGLVGGPADDALLDTVARTAAAEAQPISDLRASDDYRRHTVGVMARRAVAAATRRARGETIAVPVNRALGIGAAR